MVLNILNGLKWFKMVLTVIKLFEKVVIYLKGPMLAKRVQNYNNEVFHVISEGAL